MKLNYVPLLRIQRELQAIPRGTERFQRYLRALPDPTNTDGAMSDVVVPLLITNPMAHDHVTALLDALLALDADRIGAETAAEATTRMPDVSGDFKIAVVVADDLKGHGTNRYACELDLRFGPESFGNRARQRPWLTGVLWSSEAPTARAVREAVMTAVCRVAYGARHGSTRTLRGRLEQEGHVMAMAGCAGPVLDGDDLAYTRDVLAPFLDATDPRTAIECLFGDDAARSLGFTPRGLSPWAGLALALHDARLRLAKVGLNKVIE